MALLLIYIYGLSLGPSGAVGSSETIVASSSAKENFTTRPDAGKVATPKGNVESTPLPANPPKGGGVEKAVDDSIASRCTRVLLAGFAAMAFFRSALFTIRISGKDVGVGPVIFFQAILSAIDARVDRDRDKARIIVATTTMDRVDFTKAYKILPNACIDALQNPSRHDVDQLTQAVIAITNSSAAPKMQSILLGLALLNVVGEELLTVTVNRLGKLIQ